MQSASWREALWPGAAALWRGDWSGLVPALAFGVVLDFAILCTLVWTDWVSATVRWGSWGAVGLAIACTWWVARRAARRLRNGDLTGGPDLYPKALQEYLRGNWVEVEELLQDALAQRPQDVEVLLLQATVWRRVGRLEEAREAISALCELPGAARWRWELIRESKLIEAARRALEPEEPETATMPIRRAG